MPCTPARTRKPTARTSDTATSLDHVAHGGRRRSSTPPITPAMGRDTEGDHEWEEQPLRVESRLHHEAAERHDPDEHGESEEPESPGRRPAGRWFDLGDRRRRRDWSASIGAHHPTGSACRRRRRHRKRNKAAPNTSPTKMPPGIQPASRKPIGAVSAKASSGGFGPPCQTRYP